MPISHSRRWWCNWTDSTRTFSYDPLNNIATQTDTDMGRPGSVSLSYGALDLDRVCGVGYAGVTAPQSPALQRHL